MIGDIGWQELLIILVIIALLFGAQRVADMGKALGRGVREFKSEAIAPNDGNPSDPTTATLVDSPPAGVEAGLRALRELHEQHLLSDDEFRQKQLALLERA